MPALSIVLCRHGVYLCLLSTWQGSCTFAVVTPQVALHTEAQIIRGIHISSSDTYQQISCRAAPVTPVLSGMSPFSVIGMAAGGIRRDAHFYTQLSYELKTSIYNVLKTVDNLWDQISSLAPVVLQNHWAFDVLSQNRWQLCYAGRWKLSLHKLARHCQKSSWKALRIHIQHRTKAHRPQLHTLVFLLAHSRFLGTYDPPILGPSIKIIFFLLIASCIFKLLSRFIQSRI